MINNNYMPYLTKNIFVKAMEIPEISPETTIEETPPDEIPTPEDLIIDTGETGYISVGVFTALGALPVANAVVIVYVNDDEGEEIVITNLVSDESGRIPKIELPVYYSRVNPFESSRYYFTTYNMRIQAENYYIVNILEVRIFPGITTSYKIDLIPVIPGETGVRPDQTFIIPPSPIDISND